MWARKYPSESCLKVAISLKLSCEVRNSVCQNDVFKTINNSTNGRNRVLRNFYSMIKRHMKFPSILS